MTLQEKKMDENEMDYPEQKDEIDENIVMLTGIKKHVIKKKVTNTWM